MIFKTCLSYLHNQPNQQQGKPLFSCIASTKPSVCAHNLSAFRKKWGARVFQLQGQVLSSPSPHFSWVPYILLRNPPCQCYNPFLTVALSYPKRGPPYKDIIIPTLLEKSGNKYIHKPNYFSLQISVLLSFSLESYLSLGSLIDLNFWLVI